MCLGKPSLSEMSVGGHKLMCLHKKDSAEAGVQEEFCSRCVCAYVRVCACVCVCVCKVHGKSL